MSPRSRFSRGSLFSRLSARRWKKRIAYAALGLSCILTSLALLFYLSRRDAIQIQHISVRGNVLLTSRELVDAGSKALEGSYLGLFPKSNSLIFDRASFIQALKADFPAIESLQVERPFLTALTLVVDERSPYALWCPSSRGVKETTCYFVSAHGLIFATAPDFSEGVYIKFTSPLSTATSTLGSFLLPEERFSELSSFLNALPPLGLTPVAVVLGERFGTLEDYTITLSTGTELRVSTTQSFERTLENIKAFLSDPDIARSRELFLRRVAYLDFRFGSKAYYKFR